MHPDQFRPADENRAWEHRLLPLLVTAFGIAVAATLAATAPNVALAASQATPPRRATPVTTAVLAIEPRDRSEVMIQLQIADVVQAEGGETSVVLLSDSTSEHVLPMFLSAADGDLVQQHLHGKNAAEKSDPHNLLRHSVEALGGIVDRIELDEKSTDALVSDVILKRGDTEISLDAAPCDAFALALTTGIPVYVPNRVLLSRGIARASVKHATGGLPSGLKPPQRL
jgi:bifunctional DNase/RNase